MTASAHDSWGGVDVSVNVNDDRIEFWGRGKTETETDMTNLFPCGHLGGAARFSRLVVWTEFFPDRGSSFHNVSRRGRKLSTVLPWRYLITGQSRGCHGLQAASEWILAAF